MANQINLPVSFYFSLSFKGEQTEFMEVSGIAMAAGMDEIVGGGENRFKHRVPSNVNFQSLVLKRGIALKNSELLKWCQNTIEGSLSNPISSHTISIHLLNASRDNIITWTFHRAYPVSYSVSSLPSENNNVLIETLELSYTYFESVTHSSNNNH